MNAIRIQDSDLVWANELEHSEPPFDLWVTSDKDGRCFIVWDASVVDFYRLVMEVPHEGAKRIRDSLSHFVRMSNASVVPVLP